MSKPAHPQCQSYRQVCETHPEIREAMKQDAQKAIMSGVVTKSTDSTIMGAAEKAWRVVRGMYPARWR